MSTNGHNYTGDDPMQGFFRRRQNEINSANGQGPGQRNDILRRHVNNLRQNGADNNNVGQQNDQGPNRARESGWQKFTQLAAASALAASMPLELWLYNWAHNDDGSINKKKAFVAAALINENQRNQQNMQQVPETNRVMKYAENLIKEWNKPEPEPKTKVIKEKDGDPNDLGFYSSDESDDNES